MGSTSRALMLQAPCTVLVWDDTHPIMRGPLFMMGKVTAFKEHEWLVGSTLFDGVERFPEIGVMGLEKRLAMSTRGALLLSRAQLIHLVDEDPELLARLPLPVVVVP